MPQSISLDKISETVDQLKDELIKDTQKIIQFKTVSGGSPTEEKTLQEELPKCFEWLESKAKKFGFDFQLFDGIVAEIEWKSSHKNAKAMVIAGHVDVVTPGENWTHDAFSGEVVNGEMYGRGTQDDKGPVIQSLYAMYALKKSGVELPFDVRLVIGSQEETGDWGDMRVYCEKRGAPDFGFTPDANFPIINGEKGLVSLLIEGTWEAEGPDTTTGLEFVSLIGGERQNMVPSHCELTLQFEKDQKTEVMKELVRSTTEYVVEHDDANVTLQPNKEREVGKSRYEGVVSFIGKSAHSSSPDQGHNAILDALEFIRDIETMPYAMRRYAALMHLFGMDLHGANLGIAKDHEFIGPTSSCLVLLDIQKDKGRALFNIRPTQGSGPEDVLKNARETIVAYNEKMENLELSAEKKGDGMDPLFLDPENVALKPWLEGLKKGFQFVTGKECEFVATGGTTYAKALPNTCAFGPTLPDEPDLLHQVDERVPVDVIVRNTKIFANAIASIDI